MTLMGDEVFFNQGEMYGRELQMTEDVIYHELLDITHIEAMKGMSDAIKAIEAQLLGISERLNILEERLHKFEGYGLSCFEALDMRIRDQEIRGLA